MIHSTAIISPKATIGQNVTIGPYSIIEEDVNIGDNCIIGPHVQICRWTTLGNNCEVHKGAVLGDAPQDWSYKGCEAYTIFGDNCHIREYTVVHRGSKEGQATRIGDNCMLMNNSHLGHDCQLADHVVIGSGTGLSGHVQVGERAIISGHVIVHQFVKIGAFSLAGGGAIITRDIPPYCVMSNYGYIYGANLIGLKRNGFKIQERNAIRDIVKRYFFSEEARPEMIADMTEQYQGQDRPMLFVDFVRDTKRGIMPSSKESTR